MSKVKKGVRLDHISKIYQDPKTGKDFYAVKDTSLTIEPGSFVTLLGPSGCGKTTTLRMIAGFESPDEGEIYLGDEARATRCCWPPESWLVMRPSMPVSSTRSRMRITRS